MAETGKFRQVGEDFFVAPQLTAGDFAAARALGIATIINNRPDGEEPGQLPDEQAAECARENGMAYIQVPVVSGGIFPDHIAAMREAVANHQGPYLAYCRSGTRSCFLWSFVAAQTKPANEVVAAAAAAGYDVSSVSPVLQEIYEHNRI